MKTVEHILKFRLFRLIGGLAVRLHAALNSQLSTLNCSVLFTVLLFVLNSQLSTLNCFAQEPAWGTQAKTDSVNARADRAMQKFTEVLDRWMITDFARTGLMANTLVKTCPFLQYPAMNPELGAYLSGFEKETGATVILRAYIEAGFFNPWIATYRASQKTRKTFEIGRAKPAHAVVDIVYSLAGMKSRFEVAGYNISVRDSLRTPAFRELFSDDDFSRMRDTLQNAMGATIVKIDSAGFNPSVIRALEALKGDTKMKADPGYKVTFRKGSAAGYDPYKWPTLRKYYRTDAAGNPVPWLSTSARDGLTLTGRYEVADPEAAKETLLNMEIADLTAGAPQVKDTVLTQTLRPAGEAREVDVVANYFRNNRFGKGVETVAGQAALAVYETKEMKLVVVYEQGKQPSFSADSLKNYLNRVYGQAAVSWDVQFEAFNYAFPAEMETGNAFLSSYSSQMNTVIKAFKKSSPKIDSKACYIFLVPGIAGNVAGYMPMKGQYGFVKATSDPKHTIAHELGHGAFRLWHTFSDKNMIAAQGQTDNLMDYTDGKTKLYKHQWDLVHDPETILMPFLVNEGEEMITLKSGEYVGFSPNGRVIIKKTAIKTIGLKTGSRFVWEITDDNGKIYKWENADYIASDNKPLDSWTSDSITGKVAVWQYSKESNCYRLYKYIHVENYTANRFDDYKDLVDSPDGDWVADYNVAGQSDALRAECEKLAQAMIDSLNNIVRECDRNYKKDNPGSIAFYVNRHSHCLADLTKEERISMLRVLIEHVKGSGTGGDFDIDNAICRILISIPSIEERDEIYNILKTDKLPNGHTLLETIVDGMADDALVVFSKWMTGYIYDKKLSNIEKFNFNTKLLPFIYRTSTSKDWNDRYVWTIKRVNGKIEISGVHVIQKNPKQQERKEIKPVTLEADSLLILHFDSALRYGIETKQESGSICIIPALAFWGILEEKSERDLSLGLKVAAMIITLPATLEGGWTAVFALVDELALGSSILIDDTGWRDSVKTNEGKAWLKAYDLFTTAYFAGRALEAFSAFNELKHSYSSWEKAAVEAKEAEAIIAKMGKLTKIDKDSYLANYKSVRDVYGKWNVELTNTGYDATFGENVLKKLSTDELKFFDDNKSLLENYFDGLTSTGSRNLKSIGTCVEELKGIVAKEGNWNIFPKIKIKNPIIDADGWLMGKYVNGELKVTGNTTVAQKWDYIVKTDGEILVGRKHSWLAQGEDVIAAGEIKYTNGKIVEINNASWALFAHT